MMAGHEIPKATYVGGVGKTPDADTKKMCLARRQDIVDLFTTVGSDESSAAFQLAVASVCGVEFDLKILERADPTSDVVLGVLARTREFLAKWLKPGHYGSGQALIHMGMDMVLRRNVLTISVPDKAKCGDGARALTVARAEHCVRLFCSCLLVSFPQPPAPACVCACQWSSP